MGKIIIDCLGGDNPQEELAIGTTDCLDLPVDFVLVGEKEVLGKTLSNKGADLSRYEIIDKKNTITNDDNPRLVVAGSEDTSLVSGLLRAKEDDVIAFISPGNTGAILLGSIFRLGLLPNIKFPALGCFLVNRDWRRVLLLDCGANVDMKPGDLTKFAKMGSAYMSAFLEGKDARIGLLNVGKEEGKGNAFSKEAHNLLKESGLNFVGNIEGNDILTGQADVVLTDGFSGNIVLKAIESTAAICREIVQKASKNDESSAIINEEIHRMFGYTDLGASLVLGCRKIVLKPHGSSTRQTIRSVVELALEIHERKAIDGLGKAFGE